MQMLSCANTQGLESGVQLPIARTDVKARERERERENPLAHTPGERKRERERERGREGEVTFGQVFGVGGPVNLTCTAALL